MLLPTDLRVRSDVVRVPWAICTLSTNCESEQSLHGIQAKLMILNWSLGSQIQFEGSLCGQGAVSLLVYESQSKGFSSSTMEISRALYKVSFNIVNHYLSLS